MLLKYYMVIVKHFVNLSHYSNTYISYCTSMCQFRYSIISFVIWFDDFFQILLIFRIVHEHICTCNKIHRIYREIEFSHAMSLVSEPNTYEGLLWNHHRIMATHCLKDAVYSSIVKESTIKICLQNG